MYALNVARVKVKPVAKDDMRVMIATAIIERGNMEYGKCMSMRDLSELRKAVILICYEYMWESWQKIKPG